VRQQVKRKPKEKKIAKERENNGPPETENGNEKEPEVKKRRQQRGRKKKEMATTADPLVENVQSNKPMEVADCENVVAPSDEQSSNEKKNVKVVVPNGRVYEIVFADCPKTDENSIEKETDAVVNGNSASENVLSDHQYSVRSRQDGGIDEGEPDGQHVANSSVLNVIEQGFIVGRGVSETNSSEAYAEDEGDLIILTNLETMDSCGEVQISSSAIEEDGGGVDGQNVNDCPFEQPEVIIS